MIFLWNNESIVQKLIKQLKNIPLLELIWVDYPLVIELW